MSEEEAKKKTEEAPAQTDAMSIVMGDDAAAAPAADGKARKSRTKSFPAGIAHITASFNNTQCCISDVRGNVISWSSSGKTSASPERKRDATRGSAVPVPFWLTGSR